MIGRQSALSHGGAAGGVGSTPGVPGGVSDLVTRGPADDIPVQSRER